MPLTSTPTEKVNIQESGSKVWTLSNDLNQKGVSLNAIESMHQSDWTWTVVIGNDPVTLSFTGHQYSKNIWLALLSLLIHHSRHCSPIMLVNYQLNHSYKYLASHSGELTNVSCLLLAKSTL